MPNTHWQATRVVLQKKKNSKTKGFSLFYTSRQVSLWIRIIKLFFYSSRIKFVIGY